MKIAIDVSQIVYPGGVGIYTKNLISNLLKIDDENQYCLTAFSLRKKQVLESWFNQLKKQIGNNNGQTQFFSLPSSLAQFLFNQLRFPKMEVFTGKVSLLHTSDWTEPKSTCPKITTVHDLAPLIYPEKHDSEIVSVFKRKLALVKKESKLIIAVSQSTKNDLVRRLGIKKERIRVIYEALSEEFEKAKPNDKLIKKYNLKKFILSDAIKNPRKNLLNLIRAFEKIKDRELKLVLFGQAMWQEKEIKKQIANSSIKQSIINLGSISMGELKALYSKATAAVFPSFYEGFGLSILEAMSSGCPVIASNVSSLPEVTGEAGILINPHKSETITQAIEKINNSREVYNHLKEKGLKQVRKFSWQKTAKETLRLYQEAVK